MAADNVDTRNLSCRSYGPRRLIRRVWIILGKLPAAFDGHRSYAAYREDVSLWMCLTSLDAGKQGAALIGRLSGETKASAKTLPIETITGEDGPRLYSSTWIRAMPSMLRIN